jgi:hypothetical protein
MRDHVRRRQELRPEGKEDQAQPRNALDYLLAVDDFSVSARSVLATKTACSSVQRRKDVGQPRRLSSLDIC